MSDLVAVSLIASVPGTLAALISLFNQVKLHNVHNDLNGKLENALAAREEIGRLKGLAEGRQEPKSL